MNKPLLSIITINYNNAEGLKKTMQSVLDLEFKDYEYIIIDGGSSDNSVDVIKDFLENTELKDKITFWCSEKDKGIYNAMNKGLTHVNGTLVNMMNSGDCFISDSLNKLPIWEKENPDAVLYGAFNGVKNCEYKGTHAPSMEEILNKGICSQAVFIPKLVFDTIGYFNEDYKICADYDFYLRAYRNNVFFIFMQSIICDFDFSGISRTSNKTKIEVNNIKLKYGFSEKLTLCKIIKKIVKLLLPYFVIVFYRRICKDE